jgi:6-phosphogluconolactonase
VTTSEPTPPDVVVVDDPAGEAAERLARAVRAGGDLVLTGGRTPKAAYERVAARGLDWSGATIWLSDERCVPPDDHRSNARMIREALGAVPGFERMAAERGPVRGAEDYERRLRDRFPGGVTRFDLVLLGIGPDGHVASLFPGHDALHARHLLAVGVPEAGLEPYVARVSLTLTALGAGREVLFLATGEEKADAVARAFGGAPDESVPSSLVRPEGSLTVLLDPPAAARLA